MAIKVQDLRVGIYVQDRGGKVLRVDVIEGEKIEQKQYIKGQEVHGLTEYANFLEPIPLNEEWLKKLGFEIKTDKNGISDAFLGENPVTTDWLLKLVNTSGTWFYRNAHFQINYVHQLQNLYYALTGQELTA